MKLLLVPLALVLVPVVASGDDATPTHLIGYTEGRNDLPGGQFVNWVTNRACVVRADGKERRVLAEELTRKEHTWTQFAGWSPDGKSAIIGSNWESPENAAWERRNKTFRMTEGRLSDACLLDLATGKVTNVTAVERVSTYNSGLFYLPGGKGFGFTPLIKGVSKPHVMDLDGKNKRDVSGQGGGFAYGYSASPDGKRISYHENYQVYISNPDGGDKRKVETKNPFNFAPQWSPDGEWLLFVSGEHYNCHPHVVKKDGTGLKKLADRGGYRGVVERLKHPDFHSESSDVPVWSTDGRRVFYTAKVGVSIELMRVDLDGTTTQLTKSKPGTRHYHPAVSPDGKWVLFGSDRTGTMQLYVATTDGKDVRPITSVPEGSCAMHGHWQPAPAEPTPVEPVSFKHAGVTDAWAAYAGKLTFGKGQTLALLDDGCKLSMPEWTATVDGVPKVLVSHDSVDGDDDPKHEGKGYHGSTIGIASSLNFKGRHGVAFNNQVAVVRALECCHCTVKDGKTLAAGLQWVIDNHEKHRITAVNLAPVDDLEHDKPVATDIDAKLKKLRELGVWVSAPAGNHNFTKGISWPACQPNCFAVGAVRPGKDEVYLDRHAKVDLVVPAAATSSSNAILCGSVLLLREGIEKAKYDWKKDGPNLPEAMMTILQRTGQPVKDPGTNLTFRRLDVKAALDDVFQRAKR